MASIGSVQLKAVKTGIGHDFGGFQANVYLKNTKIGYVQDDGWGGPLVVQIEKEKETFTEVAEKLKKEKKEELFSAEETLIYSLLDLHEFEKEYKKAVKKGYDRIVHLDYRPNKIDAPVPHPPEETYFCSTEEAVTKLVKEKTPIRHEVFQSLGDFIK